MFMHSSLKERKLVCSIAVKIDLFRIGIDTAPFIRRRVHRPNKSPKILFGKTFASDIAVCRTKVGNVRLSTISFFFNLE